MSRQEETFLTTITDPLRGLENRKMNLHETLYLSQISSLAPTAALYNGTVSSLMAAERGRKEGEKSRVNVLQRDE